MSTKYPPTERVTSGKLNVDDVLLVRNRQTDKVPLEGSTWEDHRALPPGVYSVVSIVSELYSGWKRASRYYTVTVLSGGGEKYRVKVSHVQRFNRVVGE